MTTTPANAKIEAIRQSVQHSYTALNEIIDGPLANSTHRNCTRCQPRTSGRLCKISPTSRSSCPIGPMKWRNWSLIPAENFGRIMTDERRLKFISDHEHDALPQIRDLLPERYAQLEKVLSSLKDSDLN